MVNKNNDLRCREIWKTHTNVDVKIRMFESGNYKSAQVQNAPETYSVYIKDTNLNEWLHWFI